jgi:hypothetical protein
MTQNVVMYPCFHLAGPNNVNDREYIYVMQEGNTVKMVLTHWYAPPRIEAQIYGAREATFTGALNTCAQGTSFSLFISYSSLFSL